MAPVAAFTATMTNLAVAVDASGSTDSDGTIASYAWTFGDNSTGTGKTASHTYAAAGSYQVSLTVTDNKGATNTVTKTVTATAVAAKPLLIKTGWGAPTPAFVKSHIASMEQLPFDGVGINMTGGLPEQIQSQTPVSYETLSAALAPLKQTTFTTLRHNFLNVYSAPAGDLFGDWTVPLSNFTNLAQAAKEAGLEGVFYDNEEYFGDALRYPGNCANHTVAECQAKAQSRGRQVMDAMRSAWPNVRVLTTRGAWLSDKGTAAGLSGVPYNNVAWANQLVGSFVVGMVDSANGTTAKVIDGGEIYTARTQNQFATIKAWQKQGMAAHSTLIPAALKPQWATTVSAGFGVYDQPSIDVPMDAATWRTTLTNALATTDEYVWAYTERYDWWGTGWPTATVPAEWVDATRAARS